MDDSIIVIKHEDKPKFLDALKVEEGAGQLAGRSAATIGLLLIASVVLFLFMGVAGPVIAVIVFVVYTIVTSHGKKRYVNETMATPLGRLARTVADIVFVPLVGMAIYDKTLQDEEKDYIKKKMSAWGYSREFIDVFIAEWGSKHIDSIWLLIADLNLKLGSLFSSKKVYRGEIKTKDLCLKSYDLCSKMHDETNNGMPNETSERYLKELKVRFGI